MKRALTAVIGVITLIGLTACGQAGSSAEPGKSSTSQGCTTAAPIGSLPGKAGTITIGSANFPESELLADLYGQAMKAQGVTVTFHHNIGARATYLPALEQGSIGMVPEYTGAMLNFLNPDNKTRQPDQVYQELRTWAGCRAMTVTDKAPAEDVDTVTVTRATAKKYKIKTLADLAPIAGKLSIGAPSEFRDSLNGTAGLKRDYNLTFGRFVSLSPSGSITQTALRKGTVDAADIFSTDPSIAKYGYVQLADPKRAFGSENVVPLFRRDVLTQPMADGTNAVSDKLTTAALTELNQQVAQGKQSDAVAEEWLKKNGIV